MTARELARERAGTEPTESQVESIRRALRGLEREGLVEASVFGQMYARLSLDASEQAEEDAEREARFEAH
jgi:hypothetical protein